jgi:hypothetical protein
VCGSSRSASGDQARQRQRFADLDHLIDDVLDLFARRSCGVKSP